MARRKAGARLKTRPKNAIFTAYVRDHDPKWRSMPSLSLDSLSAALDQFEEETMAKKKTRKRARGYAYRWEPVSAKPTGLYADLLGADLKRVYLQTSRDIALSESSLERRLAALVKSLKLRSKTAIAELTNALGDLYLEGRAHATRECNDRATRQAQGVRASNDMRTRNVNRAVADVIRTLADVLRNNEVSGAVVESFATDDLAG